MKYFKDDDGNIFGYASDGSQDHCIPDGLTAISEVEALLLASPPPSITQLHAMERIWRDDALSDVRWLRERHRDEQDMQLATTLTGEQFAELLAYLQALRDWPQSEVFPDREQRPVAPSWVAEQAQ